MIYALKYERPARPGETDEFGTPAVAVCFTTQPYTYDGLLRCLGVWARAGPLQLDCTPSEVTWWVVHWDDDTFAAFYGYDVLAEILTHA